MLYNRVAILGSISIDTIEISGQPPFQKLGGVVIYGGLTFVQHGTEVHIFCNVSPQDQWIFDFFKSHHLEWEGKIKGATTRFLNRMEGDHRFQKVSAIADPIEMTSLSQLKNVDLVYLGPLHPEDIHRDVLDLLDLIECKIALDIQGYTRKIENGKVLPKVSPVLEEVLKHIYILKADAMEFQLVLKAFGMPIKQFQHHFGIEELVITEGKTGGDWYDFSGRQLHYVPPYLVENGDPTGAGDVFFSSYLWARFFQKYPVEKALDHASLISAKQIEGHFISRGDLVCQ